MYKKLRPLCWPRRCSAAPARVSVQRYPCRTAPGRSPSATPTPEPAPTFTEEQKPYGSAALLTDATVLVNVFFNDAAHGASWDAENRAAAVSAPSWPWTGSPSRPRATGLRRSLSATAARTAAIPLTRSLPRCSPPCRAVKILRKAPLFLRRWTRCARRWLPTAVWLSTERGRSRFCSSCPSAAHLSRWPTMPMTGQLLL